MLRSILLGLVLSIVACSGMEVSFSTSENNNDAALKQAAEAAARQGLNLVSDENLTEQVMEESFTPSKVENRKLDILMVIDDSASMQAHRDSLANNLSHLFEYAGLLNSDWRIGVISSARDSLLLQPFITAENWKDEFAALVRNPHSGDSSDSNAERVLFNASRALQGEAGRNWLRANSIAVVLVVTNEDHRQCNQEVESCSDESAYSLQNFYEELRSLRKPQVTAKIYGILSDEVERRTNFLSSIVLEGGENGSLFTNWKPLSEDYSEVLQDISKNVAYTLQSTFTLQHEYSGGGAEVVVNTADGRQITLSQDEYEIAGKMLSIYEGQLDLIDYRGEVVSVTVTYSYMGEQ